MKNLLPLLFLLCFISAQAQHEQIDSLRLELSKLSTSNKNFKTEKARLLYEILELDIQNTPEIVLKNIDTLAALYKELGNEEMYQEVSNQKRGLVLTHSEGFIAAIPYYRKYVEYLKNKKIELQNGYFYIDVGNGYYSLKLYEAALKYYNIAIDVFQKKQEIDGLATAYSCISLTYKLLTKYDSCAHYAQLAFDVRTKKGNIGKYDLAYQQYILGAALLKNQQTTKLAAVYLWRAIASFSDSNFVHDKSYAQMSGAPFPIFYELGSAYYLMQNPDSMRYVLQKLNILRKRYPIEMDDFVRLYEERIMVELYELEKNYPAAIQLCEKIFQQFNNSNPAMLFKKMTTAKRLALLCKQGGDALKEYKYGYIAYVLQDSLDRESNQDKMLALNSTLLEMENEQTIQQQQLDILEKEKSAAKERTARQILIFILALVSVFFVLMGILWWVVRKNKKLIEEYSHQLEKSNGVKELLISAFSHDLRTPFNALLNSLSLLNNELKDKTKDSAAIQSVQKAEQATRETYLQVNDLMRWVSLQRQNTSLTLQQTSLNGLVEEVLQQLHPNVIQQNVQIEKQLNIEMDLQTDAGLFQTVLRNILSNAIKFNQKQKPITLHTSVQNQTIGILRIEDNGIGIPEADLKHFFQQNTYQDVVKKGSGLGLLLVREIAEKLHIQLKVINSETGGAVFELSFPILSSKVILNENLKNEQDLDLNKNKTIESPQEIKLTVAEIDFLSPYIAKLEEFEIFESTAIKNILAQIHPPLKSQAIFNWKESLDKAVFENDELIFKQLISIVKSHV